MAERRDVRPEEMPAIVRLATRFTDLREVEAALDRKEIEADVDGAQLRPRNLREALELLNRGVISKHELRQLLGYRGWGSRLPAIFRDWPTSTS